MSHLMDMPLAHRYRGEEVFVKFDWLKPNDEIPSSAHVIAKGEVEGLGQTVLSLAGPWGDYDQAIVDAVKAAEDWIDQQMLK